MAATLDDFKQAFAGKLSPDVVPQRDHQATAALKLYKKAVDAIPADAAVAKRIGAHSRWGWRMARPASVHRTPS